MNGQKSVPSLEVTEVASRATRRRFTAEYKKKILAELDRLERGEIGALLRREGLYSSHITEWRSQLRAAEMDALTPKKRGPRPAEPNPLEKELAASQRENARLRVEIEKQAIVIDVQKKLSQLLGITFPTIPEDDKKSGSSS